MALQFHWHVADLVEEQRPVVGVLDLSLGADMGAPVNAPFS